VPESDPQAEPLTLKARYVFAGAGEPVADGTVTLEGRRIVAVGRETGIGRFQDLGNVAILPGLVNAHTHLEFSHLPKPLGKPGTSLLDWLQSVMAMRPRGSEAGRSVRRGLEECARLGTTTLGEISQPNSPIELFEEARLETTVFLELIAPTTGRVDAALELARRHLRSPASSGAWRPGLSPHAPYSVRPELLTAAVGLSAERRVPIAFHLAESREELELMRDGTGPFGDFLRGLGAWDPAAFGAGARPLDYLRSLALADRALVIHGNYLDDEEIALLAAHRDRMAVVYCPRTHAHFAHAEYPLAKMLSAGVTVGLGTDSRASAPDLSILAEMRFAARRHPDVGRHTVLQLGTIGAARALGRDREVGSLQPGKYADLTVVALPQDVTADPYDLLLDSDKPVVGRYYRGKWNGDSG